MSTHPDHRRVRRLTLRKETLADLGGIDAAGGRGAMPTAGRCHTVLDCVSWLVCPTLTVAICR